MAKYEKMLETNRCTSREKINRAKMEIDEMLRTETEVSVCELVKRTGLSRGFFYKNEEVYTALERARDLQKGKTFHKPQEVVLNKAMEFQLAALQKQIDKLQSANKNLQSENQKLQKALNKKDIAFLKGL